MQPINQIKSSSRLDVLSFLVDKRRETISKRFYRKGYSVLNNEHFKEYLDKFYNNNK